MGSQEVRAGLAKILPPSQHKKIDKIVELLDPETHSFEAVAVLSSRVGVETVDAYGLRIEVDANGDAAAVHFPYRAEVLRAPAA